jgi:putative transcriptional regulator
MPIVVNLDVMLAKRKMNLTELSARVGITIANLSVLKSGKAKAIRFSTLDEICKILNCQPGDILEYLDEEEYEDPIDDEDDGQFSKSSAEF